MFQISISRFRIALVAAAVPLVLGMAACVTENEETSTPSPGSTAPGPSPTSRSGTASPTGEASPGAGAIDCSAIGNLGIPGTTLETQGSEEPTSEFASALSDYFEEAIDNSLSDATPTCYLEGTVGDNSGLWVSFKLAEDLPPDAAELLREELNSQNNPGTTVRAMSVNILGNEFAAVTVTGASVLGEFQETGATLIMTPVGAVMVAGTTANNQ